MFWMLIRLVWGCCLFPRSKIISWNSLSWCIWVWNMNINEIKWYTFHWNFICRFYFLLTGTLMCVLRSLLHLKCLYKISFGVNIPLIFCSLGHRSFRVLVVCFPTSREGWEKGQRKAEFKLLRRSCVHHQATGQGETDRALQGKFLLRPRHVLWKFFILSVVPYHQPPILYFDYFLYL